MTGVKPAARAAVSGVEPAALETATGMRPAVDCDSGMGCISSSNQWEINICNAAGHSTRYGVDEEALAGPASAQGEHVIN